MNRAIKFFLIGMIINGNTLFSAELEKKHAADIAVICTSEQTASTLNDPTEDETLLWDASLNGRNGSVRLLVGSKTNVNYRNPHKQTPLMGAALKGHASTVATLLDLKANVNLQDAKGNTALAFAASQEHVDVARVLLHQGANLNLSNHKKETPLTDAISKQNKELIALLIAHGATGTVKDDGLNPFSTALRLQYFSSKPMGDIITMLYMHSKFKPHLAPSYPYEYKLIVTNKFKDGGQQTLEYKNIITQEKADAIMNAINKEIALKEQALKASKS